MRSGWCGGAGKPLTPPLSRPPRQEQAAVLQGHFRANFVPYRAQGHLREVYEAMTRLRSLVERGVQREMAAAPGRIT